jgi:hypothetical protein
MHQRPTVCISPARRGAAVSAGYPLVCLDTASPVDNQAGRDNATLTEPTLSLENCLKTRRVPPPHLHYTTLALVRLTCPGGRCQGKPHSARERTICPKGTNRVQVWPRRMLSGIGCTSDCRCSDAALRGFVGWLLLGWTLQLTIWFRRTTSS